jgi:Bacterial Ig-like domain (group 1)
VPVLGATSASAAEPTALSVTPATAYIRNVDGATTYRVTLNSASPAETVHAYVQSGPDATTGLSGTVTCTPASIPISARARVAIPTPVSTYDCAVPHLASKGAGLDTIRFFYDAAQTGTYQSSDPTATATLSIAGEVDSISLTPVSANVAEGGYQGYTLLVRDADGRPVPGESVTVTGTEPNVNATSIDVTTSAPTPGDTFTGTGEGTATVTTGDGSTTTTAGGGTVYAASKVAGLVTLTASSDGTPSTVSSTATLTVNPGGVNDVTSVDVSPATQKAFTSKLVSVTITLRNAQGNPVSAVTPKAKVLTGPDAGTALVVSGATDGTGSTTATYTTGATAGTDTVQAWVNQTDGTANTTGLDAGEPSGTSSVVVAAEPDFSAPGGLTGTDVNVPAGTTSVPVTFTLTTHAGTAAAGYNVAFTTTDPAPTGKYSLSQDTAVTDASGKVTVLVSTSDPAAGDSATVTAKLVGDASVTGTALVSWQARATQDLIVTPFEDTKSTHGTTTHHVTATDQFGDPVTGLTYHWYVGNWWFGSRNDPTTNPGATGTGSSFTYTDVGPIDSPGSDFLSVYATDADGNNVGSGYAIQFWVPGPALATQVNIDINDQNGYYVQRNGTGPYVPTEFVKSDTASTTDDPAVNDSANVEQVSVKLADANGNPLYGRTVTFTSSGVGVFTDENGKPIGTSITATVDGSGFATVNVRSRQAGTQTLTATADGISDTGTITYSGQYVPVTPKRLVDTRTGQGDLQTTSGSTAPKGPLMANQLYEYNYYSTDLPLDAAAYAFNVTAIKPDSAGNLRVGPSCNEGSDVPSTSLINYQKGKDVANFVIVPRGCSLVIYSDSSKANVAIDFAGYYPNIGGQNIQDVRPPTRIVDTRTGLGGSTGAIAGGSSRAFQVAGVGGIDPDAKAVALNVTAIGPTSVGNLRVYPDGAAVPNTSNINYIRGQDKAAFVVMDLPANGKIRVYSDYGSANVAIDAFEYYPATSTLVTSVPTRILDTRDTGSLTANHAMSIPVAGHGGVPADAEAVLVSVTGIHKADSTGYGNLRVYPTGASVPTVSTLNYVSKTSDVANFDIVQLGTDGELSLYSDSSPIDVAVDVLGYVPAGS